MQGRYGSGSPRSGQYRPSAKAAVPGGRRALRPPWREVEVVAAELGNDAGVLGAAALVL